MQVNSKDKPVTISNPYKKQEMRAKEVLEILPTKLEQIKHKGCSEGY